MGRHRTEWVREIHAKFIGSQTAMDLFYVTHHKEELPPCITHALVLANGKIVAAGERKKTLGSLMAELVWKVEETSQKEMSLSPLDEKLEAE